MWIRQAIAKSNCRVEVERACISATSGEQPVHIKQSFGSLKKVLQAVMSHLEEMRRKHIERKSQFTEVLIRIHSIPKELSRSAEENPLTIVTKDSNLSLNRLEDSYIQLLSLQTEKVYLIYLQSDQQKLVLGRLNSMKSLCLVVGTDYSLIIHEIHPTLDDSCGTKRFEDTEPEKELQGMQNVHKTPVASPMKNVSSFNERETPKILPIAMPETPSISID
ncbi:unnamed protein product [Fraxinus pennsylvanica]|uniref:Uncharacterized protein n=1 Tax=Fraxinus pennsylvanica TaxID=56036 RepID=A0AAD2EBK9_9LAMI|nr:unnamed protein product [Fraxinus pennsylvanica]